MATKEQDVKRIEEILKGATDQEVAEVRTFVEYYCVSKND